MNAIYDTDTEPTAPDRRKPMYRRFGGMSPEDLLDAALANLSRTGRDRGGRADRAMRRLAVAR